MNKKSQIKELRLLKKRLNVIKIKNHGKFYSLILRLSFFGTEVRKTLKELLLVFK